jgi:hypothetical protein
LTELELSKPQNPTTSKKANVFDYISSRRSLKPAKPDTAFTAIRRLAAMPGSAV